MKEIEVNVAYYRFLGLDILDPVFYFSTFGKNYICHFKDTALFEQIFSKILEDCMKYKLLNTEQIFVDATYLKVCTNSKKMCNRVAHEQILWYDEKLNKESEQDCLAHGKNIKEKNDDYPPIFGETGNDKDSVAEDIRHTIGNDRSTS